MIVTPLLFVYLCASFGAILAVTNNPSESVALYLAGFCVPFVTQLVKKHAGVDSFKAFLMTSGFAVLFSLGASWWTGEIHTLGDVSKNAGAVLGVATVVFNVLKEAGAMQTAGANTSQGPADGLSQ